MNRAKRRHATKLANRKQTHRLKPQVCNLWIREFNEFVMDFNLGKLTTTDMPELAACLREDQASSMAIAIMGMTKLHIQVRACHLHA